MSRRERGVAPHDHGRTFPSWIGRRRPPPCSSPRPRPASVTTIPTCRSQRVPVGRRRMTSGDCQDRVTVGFWCDDGEKDHHSETTVRMQARRLAPWQATPMRRKARAVRPPAFRCGWNRYGNRHCHDPPPGDRRVGVSPSPRPCAVGRGRRSGATEVDWAESFVGVGGRPGVPLVGGSGFVSPKLPGGFRARGEDPPTGVQEPVEHGTWPSTKRATAACPGRGRPRGRRHRRSRMTVAPLMGQGKGVPDRRPDPFRPCG